MKWLRFHVPAFAPRFATVRASLVAIATVSLGAMAACLQLVPDGEPETPHALAAGIMHDERVRSIGDWSEASTSPAGAASSDNTPAPFELAPLELAPPLTFTPEETEPQPIAARQITSLPEVDRSHPTPRTLIPPPAAASARDQQDAVATAPGFNSPVEETASAGHQLKPQWPQTAEARVVSDLAREQIVRGFSLGERNAVFAARKEFAQALRQLAQAADAASGLAPDHADSCELALRRGLEALGETEDFAACDGDRQQLAHLLAGHRTPLARQTSFPSTVAAQQAYLTFAGEELIHAAAGCPLAAQALVGLGKCCQLEAKEAHTMLRQGQALACYRAAVQTDPRNHLAANEFGVLLGKFGQWNQAKRVLLSAVSMHGDAAGWQNLAIVHTRLGEHELARLAAGECQRCQGTTGGNVYSAVDGRATVQWVDPRAFGGPPDDAPVSREQLRQARSTSFGPSRR